MRKEAVAMQTVCLIVTVLNYMMFNWEDEQGAVLSDMTPQTRWADFMALPQEERLLVWPGSRSEGKVTP